MRLSLSILLVMVLTACVPTTRYKYVPLTQQNFEAAQNGDAIPLVRQSTSICFSDGRIELLRDARWTDSGICSEDGLECYDHSELVGVGIPYESRSLSAVPMAAVKVGKCDPEALSE